MNSDPVLGIVLGITLVSPQLMSASDYVQAVATGGDIKTWDFGAFHINMVGYQSQVIPAILVGILFSVLYKFLKKHVPEMISMIVVPFFSLVPAVLLAHTVIGPFGRVIGDGLAKIIQVALILPSAGSSVVFTAFCIHLWLLQDFIMQCFLSTFRLRKL